MERMRIYVTNEVSEQALAHINALEGVEAGDGVIIGTGEPRSEEAAVLLFYDAPEGKGEIRIPFSSIAIADEGVVRGRMKRTGMTG
ncbi:MAG: hypothetical protein GX131_16560 [candidate division WS1 bacterium]|jgi:hypothetical protein|nr:hypothetical protein [candidate division WS1 bacterium]